MANDQAIYAMAGELGWSMAWLNRRGAAPTPSNAPLPNQDIAMLMQNLPRVPPPALASEVGTVPGLDYFVGDGMCAT